MYASSYMSEIIAHYSFYVNMNYGQGDDKSK